MIRKVQGNLFDADVQALVNTVNTVGVMGRGIALQFKQAFPENYKAYRKICDRGELEPGKVYIFDLNTYHNPQFIVNFPTKKHWRGKSKLEYIQLGLESLVREIERLDIKSIAIPPLGCGLGGLEWDDVYREIETAVRGLDHVDVLVFEPAGAPAAAEMTTRTKAPKMTAGRAVLIELMRRYLQPLMDDVVTLLEIHKLMYLMQESGESLRLEYVKGAYGPYSTNLHHVLERIESHFITGYGDGAEAPGKTIEYKSEAARKATDVLEPMPETRERLARVEKVIQGFETPYGMEMLASVHWIACHENELARSDMETAVAAVRTWNERKERMFKPEHLGAAWKRLREQGWLAVGDGG